MTRMLRRVLAGVLGLLCAFNSVHAIDHVRRMPIHIAPGAVQSNEMWAVTSGMKVEGELKHDAYLYTAEPLEITGVCRGDVFAFTLAGLEFDGTIEEDLKVAAPRGVINLAKPIGGSVVVLGQTVKVGGESGFREGVIVGQDVIVEGHITGDLKIFGGAVTINAVVDGDLRCAASELIVMAGTRIGGDFVYTLDSDLVLSKDVLVGGEVKKAPMPATILSRKTRPFKEKVILQCYFLAGAVFAGAVWVLLFPRTSRRSVNELLKQPVRCCLWGSIAFLALVFSMFAGTGLLIGLPLALMIGLLFSPILYFAKILTALAIGQALMRDRDSKPWRAKFMMLLSGLTILYGISLLDAIQPVIWMLAVTGGLGAWIMTVRANEVEGPVIPPVPPQA